ncbi:MAG: hypothetical protein HXM02_06045 [[Eubacterium] sulci]|nr:hypothetical protein [[Eubacterium] sulci]
MFDLNKGFAGLFRYEGTPLELTIKDNVATAFLKGCARGVINGTIMIGGVVIIAAGVSTLTNNSDK